MSKSRVFCDDWGCPAKVSCAHHFGRSHAYASMKGADAENSVHTRTFGRKPGADDCADYRFDRPRPWLLPPAPIKRQPAAPGEEVANATA